MKNFAVFVSGHGSNLQAIISKVKTGGIKAKLKLVVSNKKEAYALKRAKRAKISCLVVEAENFKSREDFDREVIKHLKKQKIDFVVLAGFMRILSPVFVRAFKNKILNIHPALLPNFKGAHAIKDAFEAKVKITGVTVHFVDEKVDHGAIILQEPLPITSKDTLATLEKRIHTLEHQLYPRAIDLFARGQVKILGRRVVLRGSL